MHAQSTQSTQSAANAADFRFQTTINPNLTQAVHYWAGEFDVPPATLIQVVREVGRNVLEVRRHLSM